MIAKDIMHKRVVTVPPNMTVRELSRLLIDKGISGAPVVDARGHLLGVVSQTDLVRRDRELAPEGEVPGYYRQPDKSYFKNGFQIESPDYARVKDVMTPAVLSAEEKTPVDDLARMMLARHIHRIVITKEDRLCGIVTSMDMLRALLAAGGRKRRTKSRAR